MEVGNSKKKKKNVRATRSTCVVIQSSAIFHREHLGLHVLLLCAVYVISQTSVYVEGRSHVEKAAADKSCVESP